MKTAINCQKRWDILLVEDDKDSHKMFKLVLRKFLYKNKGLKIHSAYDIESARSQLIKNLYSVVLLDVVLQEQTKKPSGLLLIKTIRNLQPDAAIILYTGHHGNYPLVDLVKNNDIDAFLAKPEDLDSKLEITILLAIKAHERIKSIRLKNRRNKTMSQLSEKMTAFKSTWDFIDIVFLSLANDEQIESLAVFESGKVKKSIRTDNEIIKVYKSWFQLDKQIKPQIYQDHYFLRFREFPQYVFVIKSDDDDPETYQFAMDLTKHGETIRLNIIKILNNKKLLEDLHYLLSNKNKILIITPAGRSSIIHLTSGKTEKIKRSLSSIKLYFSDDYLIRIDKSLIINRLKIREIVEYSSREVEVMLTNKKLFKVSRSHISEVLRIKKQIRQNRR